MRRNRCTKERSRNSAREYERSHDQPQPKTQRLEDGGGGGAHHILANRTNPKPLCDTFVFINEERSAPSKMSVEPSIPSFSSRLREHLNRILTS